MNADEKKPFGYGEYHYFRCREWDGGWGVRRTSDSEIVALTFDKNMAGIIADILNHHAKEYDLHEMLKKIPMSHKIACGAIYDIFDLHLTREERLIGKNLEECK